MKECRGQLAVECGDDPPGGLCTLSAHQMAHGGVIPHSSSSELSAHQMPARLTSSKLQRIRLLFGAKTGKGRVRGHMMCLPHLTWITAFDDTVKSTYTEENATETVKQVRERLSTRPHGVAGAPPRICPGEESARTHDVSAAPLPVLYRLVNKDVVGPGIVGPDAEANGPGPARHLSGLDWAQHDACADPRYARKNKRRARDLAHLTTVHCLIG